MVHDLKIYIEITTSMYILDVMIIRQQNYSFLVLWKTGDMNFL